jgi:hypothetical protein
MDKKISRLFKCIEPDLTIPVDKNTNSKKSPQLRELKVSRGG